MNITPAPMPRCTDEHLAREVAAVKDYYAMEGHVVGGALHIVLDDGNVAEHHIRFCMEEGAADCCGRCVEQTLALGQMLLAMTEAQREHLQREHYWAYFR